DKKMEPGDLVLIVATGGGSGVFQQFTSDQRILRAAVDRLRPFIFSTDSTPHRKSPERSMPAMPMGTLGQRAQIRTSPLPDVTHQDPVETGDALATLGALND